MRFPTGTLANTNLKCESVSQLSGKFVFKKNTYQNINVKAPRRNFPAALRLYFIDLINQITLLKCTINYIKHVNIEQLIPIIIVNVVICI